MSRYQADPPERIADAAEDIANALRRLADIHHALILQGSTGTVPTASLRCPEYLAGIDGGSCTRFVGHPDLHVYDRHGG